MHANVWGHTHFQSHTRFQLYLDIKSSVTILKLILSVKSLCTCRTIKEFSLVWDIEYVFTQRRAEKDRSLTSTRT